MTKRFPFRYFKTRAEMAASDHFNHERHRSSRGNFKLNRSAALAEWRALCVG